MAVPTNAVVLAVVPVGVPNVVVPEAAAAAVPTKEAVTSLRATHGELHLPGANGNNPMAAAEAVVVAAAGEDLGIKAAAVVDKVTRCKAVMVAVAAVSTGLGESHPK